MLGQAEALEPAVAVAMVTALHPAIAARVGPEVMTTPTAVVAAAGVVIQSAQEARLTVALVGPPAVVVVQRVGRGPVATGS
jgi:hypothetical protein